jgi:hypothetical protein
MSVLPLCSRDRETSTWAMPCAAPAALASTVRRNALRPMMSATLNIMVMSMTSTYAAVFPEATVETMTFGRP